MQRALPGQLGMGINDSCVPPGMARLLDFGAHPFAIAGKSCGVGHAPGRPAGVDCREGKTLQNFTSVAGNSYNSFRFLPLMKRRVVTLGPRSGPNTEDCVPVRRNAPGEFRGPIPRRAEPGSLLALCRQAICARHTLGNRLNESRPFGSWRGGANAQKRCRVAGRSIFRCPSFANRVLCSGLGGCGPACCQPGGERNRGFP